MRFHCARSLAVIVLFASLCAPSAWAQRMYTAYNMWYEKPDHLYAINYKKGTMIPAGTEVSDVGVSQDRRPMIVFTTVKDGQMFKVEFEEKYHPGFSLTDYTQKMFTSKSLSELTKGMSKEETQAIKDGKLVVGMSKAAVIVAYGYPPEHATANTESNRWTYWLDRFRKKVVYFNDAGRTRKPPADVANEL